MASIETTPPPVGTGVAKMRRYRAGLRAAGLRPVQIWVPDVRSARFKEEARAQSLRVRHAADERDAIDWIAATADTDSWT